MILNPNCSEEVFRLEGTLEEIKSEVLKMLNIVKRDYANVYDGKSPGQLSEEEKKRLIDEDKKRFSNIKRQIAAKSKEVRKITNIKEFRDLVFPFTCNYETFFKPENEDLLVATCNNTDWAELNTTEVDMDEEGYGYYDITECKDYDLLCKGDDWVYVAYNNKHPLILNMQPARDNATHVELMRKGERYYFVKEKFIEARKMCMSELTKNDIKKIEEADKKLIVRRLGNDD